MSCSNSDSRFGSSCTRDNKVEIKFLATEALRNQLHLAPFDSQSKAVIHEKQLQDLLGGVAQCPKHDGAW